MKIDDLTFGELKQIAAMFNNQKNTETLDEGHCVVLLDRGFIMVGHLVIEGNWATIKDARCLRSWSSGKGLEWHIENGKEKTTLDGVKTNRRCHISKLQNWAKTDESKW